VQISTEVGPHPNRKQAFDLWSVFVEGRGVPIGADWDLTKPSFLVQYQVLIRKRRGVPIRC
jgi:hypothetical protein